MHLPAPSAPRGVFCNRTLNLRSIQAIGYDMDYTLIHYDVSAWEGVAYAHLKRKLLEEDGWPIEALEFDPTFAIRGLVLDMELGNLVKPNRFGYIKRAMHGTRALPYPEMRRAYQDVLVDLRDPRFMFLNTFFSISEACMYAQLVDLLDAGQLPDVSGYTQLYRRTRQALDMAHMEGLLKAEIMAAPERFVVLDPEAPLALLDQQRAGKRLMVITNSEWSYTSAMMTYAFDRFLPEGTTWRDLFELVIVSARKPVFFESRNPALRVTDSGLLAEHQGPLQPGEVYFGADAMQIERSLGVSGDQILYVGDHLFTDVNVSKSLLRWRTALILRELEDEIAAAERERALQQEIQALMSRKEALEHEFSLIRLDAQRIEHGYGPRSDADPATLRAELKTRRDDLVALDAQIGPLVAQQGSLFNTRWGMLTRTGNDKSHLTRQIERYADIYTSRVSNLLFPTPFVIYRSPRGTVPHDLV